MATERPRNGERVVERWNRTFESLTADPRRQLLASLLDAPAGRSVPLPEAATSPTLPQDREELQVALRHRHLPLLAGAGFVQWEREPFRAWRGPNFEEAAVVLRALEASVDELPDQLVDGCRRLEREREYR